MLELFKQLADVVNLMVHNKIQVAQQQANMKDNSSLAGPWENVANGNASANQLGGNLSNHRIGNTGKCASCKGHPMFQDALDYRQYPPVQMVIHGIQPMIHL